MREEYSQYFTELDEHQLSGEKLTLAYVRLSEVPLWDTNPKRHDFGKIIESIDDYDFQDPSKFDASLQAIVAGNGRIMALRMMEKDDYDPPRGILVDNEGSWCIPVIFGVDADSRMNAIRYGIDHNNLTMMGSDEFTAWDIKKMYDEDIYFQNLSDLQDADLMPATVDHDDFEYLMDMRLRIDNPENDEDEDSGGHQPDNGDGDPPDDEPEVMIVTTTNFNLVGEIFDAIQELLEMNPGWDAKISLN